MVQLLEMGRGRAVRDRGLVECVGRLLAQCIGQEFRFRCALDRLLHGPGCAFACSGAGDAAVPLLLRGSGLGSLAGELGEQVLAGTEPDADGGCSGLGEHSGDVPQQAVAELDGLGQFVSLVVVGGLNDLVADDEGLHLPQTGFVLDDACVNPGSRVKAPGQVLGERGDEQHQGQADVGRQSVGHRRAHQRQRDEGGERGGAGDPVPVARIEVDPQRRSPGEPAAYQSRGTGRRRRQHGDLQRCHRRVFG